MPEIYDIEAMVEATRGKMAAEAKRTLAEPGNDTAAMRLVHGRHGQEMRLAGMRLIIANAQPDDGGDALIKAFACLLAAQASQLCLRFPTEQRAAVATTVIDLMCLQIAEHVDAWASGEDGQVTMVMPIKRLVPDA